MRKVVRDNIFDQICAVFDQGKIDYVKWDMNRSMADVYAGNLAYDYVLGVYDFMERLVTRYPDILLEGCCGGGGRFDAGMPYKITVWHIVILSGIIHGSACIGSAKSSDRQSDKP